MEDVVAVRNMLKKFNVADYVVSDDPKSFPVIAAWVVVEYSGNLYSHGRQAIGDYIYPEDFKDEK